VKKVTAVEAFLNVRDLSSSAGELDVIADPEVSLPRLQPSRWPALRQKVQTDDKQGC
jgi:hypothetical protein